MELYSGNYKVIDSGTIILYDEKSNVKFLVKPSVKFSFELIIEFEENGGERNLLKKADENPNIITLKCINFGEGAGTIEPIELAVVGGKRVSLHLWVKKIADTKYIREMTFTIYIER